MIYEGAPKLSTAQQSILFSTFLSLSLSSFLSSFIPPIGLRSVRTAKLTLSHALIPIRCLFYFFLSRSRSPSSLCYCSVSSSSPSSNFGRMPLLLIRRSIPGGIPTFLTAISAFIPSSLSPNDKLIKAVQRNPINSIMRKISVSVHTSCSW